MSLIFSVTSVRICAFTIRSALTQSSHSVGEAEAGVEGDHVTQAHVTPKSDENEGSEGAGEEGCDVLVKKGATPRYP